MPIRGKRYQLEISSLKKGWQEWDELLIHAMFQILCNFVAEEKQSALTDWNDSKEHRRVWKEIRDLYAWWTQVRPKRQSPIEQLDKKDYPKRIFTALPDKEGSRELTFQYRTPASKKRYLAASLSERRAEKRWFKEDTRMMNRLVAVRAYLWV
jgi:hypothetical protein